MNNVLAELTKFDFGNHKHEQNMGERPQKVMPVLYSQMTNQKYGNDRYDRQTTNGKQQFKGHHLKIPNCFYSATNSDSHKSADSFTNINKWLQKLMVYVQLNI